MAVLRSEKVECECGGTSFVAVVEIWRHPNQGSTARPLGHRCLQCNEMMNPEVQNRLAELKRRRAALAEVEAEIAELEESQPPPPTKKSRAKVS